MVLKDEEDEVKRSGRGKESLNCTTTVDGRTGREPGILGYSAGERPLPTMMIEDTQHACQKSVMNPALVLQHPVQRSGWAPMAHGLYPYVPSLPNMALGPELRALAT